ncbi:efflux RND transporter periplasmic adaptor subunit [Affinibrenneria salicis]|uniref:Efflux RND transporter periplasmic adaptor subunit n=1 Tax=Affinibrenneria salicis TaxID=2590031 RepID=A0A5J5G7X0_9GAMM|nr:efflux RND transporter periplasmic adaptor subunit [Affinibrenneria salicis]KAA9002520.1 efflux RND transporter periplasmic adaptor subunit [Affinibrenneria salicis]KAA9003192.1 efflux RND transporter periplasmic adaptor subunit [Affinibrenneria salicis]
MPSRLLSPRRSLVVLCLILLAILLYVIFAPSTAQPDYITARAEVRDLEQTVLADGTIEAQKLVSVGAQATGQIKTLHVALGDKVTKGQLIAEIDDLTQQNAFKDSEAALKNIQAQRNARLATLRNNQLNWQRQQRLAARGLGARIDFDSAQAELDVTQAEISALDAQIVQAQIAVNTAQVNLGYTRIVSPMDGTVVAIPVEEGQTVNAAQSTPTIAKVANLDTVTVEAQISEADVIKVKTGMPVWFTILGDPAQRYHATLRAIEPAPDSISSDSSSSSSSSSTSSSSTSSSAIYYNGLFDVDNPQGTLRISMTAQVYILLNSVKDAVVVPATALDAFGPHATLQVVDDQGRIEQRNVTVGLNDNVYTQIVSGLKAGENVIVSRLSPQSDASAPRRPGPPMRL